jgi:hypothetical protein
LSAEGTKVFGKERGFSGNAAPVSVQHGHGGIDGLFIVTNNFPRLEQQRLNLTTKYYICGVLGHFSSCCLQIYRSITNAIHPNGEIFLFYIPVLRGIFYPVLATNY